MKCDNCKGEIPGDVYCYIHIKYAGPGGMENYTYCSSEHRLNHYLNVIKNE